MRAVAQNTYVRCHCKFWYVSKCTVASRSSPCDSAASCWQLFLCCCFLLKAMLSDSVVCQCDFSSEIFFSFSFVFHCVFSFQFLFSFCKFFHFSFSSLYFLVSVSVKPLSFYSMHHFSLKSTVCLMLGLMFGMRVVLFLHCKLLLHCHC